MLKGRLRIPESASDILEGLETIIIEIVQTFNPISIVVTGSLAEGRFVRGLSDVDLLVILGRPVPESERFMLRTVKDVDVEITLVSVEELKRAVAEGRDFYIQALRSGIVVYGGDPNDYVGC